MVYLDYFLEEKMYTDPESINFTKHFVPLFLKAINSVKITSDWMFQKSRRLDVGLTSSCPVHLTVRWPAPYGFPIF